MSGISLKNVLQRRIMFIIINPNRDTSFLHKKNDNKINIYNNYIRLVQSISLSFHWLKHRVGLSFVHCTRILERCISSLFFFFFKDGSNWLFNFLIS